MLKSLTLSASKTCAVASLLQAPLRRRGSVEHEGARVWSKTAAVRPRTRGGSAPRRDAHRSPADCSVGCASPLRTRAARQSCGAQGGVGLVSHRPRRMHVGAELPAAARSHCCPALACCHCSAVRARSQRCSRRLTDHWHLIRWWVAGMSLRNPMTARRSQRLGPMGRNSPRS